MRHFDNKQWQANRERGFMSGCARIGDALRNPTKRELRDELVDAVRNTASLQIPTEGETDAPDH